MATTSLQAELRAHAQPEKIGVLSSYFKTGPGEYGEGDIFIGIAVPDTRRIAEKYKLLPYGDIDELMKSHIHEFRLCAVLILGYRYNSEADERKRIVDYYLENTAHINNWDLVDCSARDILGEYYADKSRKKLYDLAKSKNLWERRMAIIATWAFIKKHQFADTFAICEILLSDKHDLMHKACGWMLREVYKQSPGALEPFLRKHARNMPRTMLRYAIEKMSPQKRKAWLAASK